MSIHRRPPAYLQESRHESPFLLHALDRLREFGGVACQECVKLVGLVVHVRRGSHGSGDIAGEWEKRYVILLIQLTWVTFLLLYPQAGGPAAFCIGLQPNVETEHILSTSPCPRLRKQPSHCNASVFADRQFWTTPIQRRSIGTVTIHTSTGRETWIRYLDTVTIMCAPITFLFQPRISQSPGYSCSFIRRIQCNA